MAKKKRNDHPGRVLRLVTFTIILFLLMGGTLGGLYLYMEYLISLNEREGFTADDLVSPIAREKAISPEKRPVFISPWKPGIDLECLISLPTNGTDGKFKIDGYMGIGAVLNLSLKNAGETSLYVERAHARSGWGGGIAGAIGKYIAPGEERYMRHLLLPIPDPPPDVGDRTVTISFDILVKSGLNWYRRDGVEYPPYPVNILEPLNRTSEVKVLSNPTYYYDRVNDLVREDRNDVRALVENGSLGEGPFTIQKIADAQQFVRNTLSYIPDPDTGRNQWISPMTCLDRGGGDCEDFSILFGAVINAMGGNARVIITSEHAFNAVYIGQNDTYLSLLQERYGMNVPFQVWEDELGKWLIVEPQSQLVFGWFPLDVAPASVPCEGRYIYGLDGYSWQFVDSDEISIVDIYCK